MLGLGFQFLTYPEVLALADTESKPAKPVVELRTIKTVTEKKPAFRTHMSDLEFLGFYYDYPDAWGQNL